MKHRHSIACIERGPGNRLRCKYDPPGRRASREDQLTKGVVISNASPEFVVENHEIYLSEKQHAAGYPHFKMVVGGMSSENLARLRWAMDRSHFSPEAIAVIDGEIRNRS